MNKKVIATILGGIGLLGISSQASALNDFDVDPNSINGNGLGIFTADSISGISSGLIKLDSNTNTASESGYLNLTQFVKNGNGIFGSLTGLGGASYQLYALFDLTASLATGSFGQNGSTYTLDTLNFHMFADPDLDTSFNQAAFGTDASVTVGAADIAIANGTLDFGTAAINLGGVALNSTTDFNLTPAGEDYFVEPDPFYSLALEAFNNTGGAVDFNFDSNAGCAVADCEIVVLSGVGTLDFDGEVPEPTTLALLAMGLLGMGNLKLRKKA